MSKSSVYTMLQTSAANDRILQCLPPPFIRQATPYIDGDFDEKVKNAINSGRFVQTGMKLSKLIILGDVSTGKTCLVNRFCHHIFNSNYKATIGVDFEVERFDIMGIPFNLQIWDTAGQERFKCIAASYYRGANIIMICFDVTNIVSLAHSTQWLEEARDANPNTNPLVWLVATKRDLLMPSSYKLIETQALRVATNLRAEYWSISSKTGDCVEQLFKRLAAVAFNVAVQKEILGNQRHSQISSNGIKIGQMESISKSSKMVQCSPQCRK